MRNSFTFSNKVFFISILLTLLTANLLAQEKEKSELPLKEGTWALQFGIAPNFTLTSFQGGVISAKFHNSDNTAIRFGIGVGHSQKDFEGNSNYYENEATNVANLDGFDKRSNYYINCQYLWNSNINESFSLFYGFGPTVGFSIRDNENKEFYTWNKSSHFRKNRNNEWAVGLICALGVEWFVNSNISIGAEYGFKATYNWGGIYTKEIDYDEDQNITRDWDSDKDYTGFNVGGSRVLFGVSIYF